MGFAEDIRNTEAIRLADIIGAVEDTPQIATVRAPSARQDRMQVLWDPVDAKVVDSLRLVTFRSLLLKQLAKGVKVQQKPALNRGVFRRVSSRTILTIRINAPISDLALGQPVVARN